MSKGYDATNKPFPSTPEKAPDLQAIEEQIGQVIRSRNFWLPEDQDVIVALTKDIAALLLTSQQGLLGGLIDTATDSLRGGNYRTAIDDELTRIKQAKQELGK